MLSEENFVDFQCPYCGEAVSFPREDVGFARACPICMETLVVPADGAASGVRLPLPIEAQRVVLRRFAPGDWRDLVEVVSDEELFRYTAGGPLQEDEVLHWLESEAVVKLTTHDQMFYLGIQLKESGKVLGYVGLRFSDPLQASLHIVLSRAHQRKALACEALEALFDFCFNIIHLHRLSARCDSRNAAARKLCQNLRMRHEGEFLQDTHTPEGWLSSAWYAILREEYLAPAPAVQ
jgi:RimJ/RimL family protein N-acetyltransferase